MPSLSFSAPAAPALGAPPPRRCGGGVWQRWALAALWWAAWAGAGRAGWAQPAADQSVGATPFRFARPGTHRVGLPVVQQRNLLVVSAKLNGHGPYNFLLDTGVGISLLTNPRLADSLGLRRGQQFRVVGAGGESTGLLAYEAANARVELPGVVAPQLKILVLSEDVLNLSNYVGMPIHGILGSELFRSFVVTVQPDLDRLALTDPARYRAPRGRRWAAVPLRLERNKAYVEASVQLLAAAADGGAAGGNGLANWAAESAVAAGRGTYASAAAPDRVAARPPLPPVAEPPLALKLVLDTGAGHALSLETGSDPRLHLPAQYLRTDLGRGLTGNITGCLGRVASVSLGGYRLDRVLTSFPDSAQVRLRLRPDEARHGNLGYELLKRFSFVVDYPHGRLLLRPNSRLREPFEHDMCGLDLLATGPDYRRYLVQHVAPNSPAAAAGIQADEEIVSINLLPVNTMTLSQVSRLLHSQDGRALFFLLRTRNGELRPATVRLKRQI